jgi:hypothetical protein
MLIKKPDQKLSELLSHKQIQALVVQLVKKTGRAFPANLLKSE